MASVTIKAVIESLERMAPRAYQEDYDNSGLITGNPEMVVTGILVTLDCTEAVLDEAVARSCNLIVAHHPILFKGIKRLTGQTYVERVLIKAIQHNVAIYAIHTNLDNVIDGVNKKIANAIGLKNLRILAPKKNTLLKLVTFTPREHVERVTEALYKAGAGQIGNYKNCSFQLLGEGTFLPTADAKPYQGTLGTLERTSELRVEVILPAPLKKPILAALRSSHPYEEVAYYLSVLENENQEVGAGIVGDLPAAEEPVSFLKRLKTVMKTECVRHTKPIPGMINTVAVCGGSGSFLLPQAIASGAQVYISADFKYHEFFDAEGKIMVADIGHYESEQFTKDLLGEYLTEKFPTFAVAFSKVITNPISYL